MKCLIYIFVFSFLYICFIDGYNHKSVVFSSDDISEYFVAPIDSQIKLEKLRDKTMATIDKSLITNVKESDFHRVSLPNLSVVFNTFI